MTRNSSLIVVSNRVPSPQKSSASQGGLAVGLMDALQEHGGLWIGWSGALDDKQDAPLHHSSVGSVHFATFSMTQEEYDKFYVGFSNEVLWPLFHYRTDKLTYNLENLETYLLINERYASHIAAMAAPHSRIWVHDYQLIAVGHFLRQAGLKAPLGFFLHTPFPPWDVLRTLPEYEDLLHYLSAYDVVGFQTRNDLRNFQDSMCNGLKATAHKDGTIETDGRRFKAAAYPISIDVETSRQMAGRGMQGNLKRRLAASVGDRTLVIGVDRLDYSKGLHKRFFSFERFLEKHEQHHRNVVFMQISPPSRSDVPEYAELRTDLEGVAGHVNGRFSDYDWTPLSYLNRGYSHEAILGFLRMSRVGLVTPLRDGMNLVAKEFVAAQDPEDPGVLVLSHLAGAAWELQCGALICNPYDIEGVADLLEEALTMPLAERRERWERMMEVLRHNDIHYWRRSFLDDLNKASRPEASSLPRIRSWLRNSL